jgi:hypothetical protein
MQGAALGRLMHLLTAAETIHDDTGIRAGVAHAWWRRQISSVFSKSSMLRGMTTPIGTWR